jgi:ubiquinone/menaquinone biosynthesis C-methylase UbiE
MPLPARFCTHLVYCALTLRVREEQENGLIAASISQPSTHFPRNVKHLGAFDMKTVANQNPQEQENVNAYFQSRVSKWKNIYASDCLSGEIYRARQTTVLDWIDSLALEPGSRVLEVGCGAGFLSIALAQRGFRLQAIDSVEAMVELASQHAADMQLTNLLSLNLGDVNSLTFEDSTFDLVVGLGVIPWLEKPELAMHEIARVTRPGGYVILTTGNWTGLIGFLDPVHNPMLKPLKQGLNKVIKLVGLHYRVPIVNSQFCRDVDKTLASIKLDKVRGKTLGFGPFTLFNRTVIPHALGKWLHIRLQLLADRNVPGFRSTGKHYLVLTRKSACVICQIKDDVCQDMCHAAKRLEQLTSVS